MYESSYDIDAREAIECGYDQAEEARWCEVADAIYNVRRATLAELAAMEIAVARRREELASGAEYGGDEAMSTTPTTGDSEPAEPCPF